VTLHNQLVGATGEDLAAEWYVANGYEVLARNWRVREGEIDIVVRRARTLVFCEVKSRSSLDYGTPAEAVTREKRDRVRHLAAQYLQVSPVRAREIRFDIAAVVDGHLEMIEGAF
jgi:putative endonuclease